MLERYNGGGATVAGVNVEAKAAFSRWFDLQAGITWQRSRYEHAQHWSDDAPTNTACSVRPTGTAT